MEARRKKHVKRDWSAVVKEYDRSGMTVKEFCRVQKISQSLFYNRRKELKDSFTSGEPALRSDDFIKLSSSGSPGPPISLVFPGPIELFVCNDCDRVLLGDVISQLKESLC